MACEKLFLKKVHFPLPLDIEFWSFLVLVIFFEKEKKKIGTFIQEQPGILEDYQHRY